MNFTLSTNRSDLYGIFGKLTSEDGLLSLFSLEHAYKDGSIFVPKLSRGKTYTCQRGTHQLTDGIPFETFEILGVPDFQGIPVTGILVHPGNYNSSSHGCICVGMSLGVGCILESRHAFDAFMAIQEGIDTFLLTVS